MILSIVSVFDLLGSSTSDMTMLEASSSFTDPTNLISLVDLISSLIFSELVDTFLNLPELATPILVAESTNQDLPPILISSKFECLQIRMRLQIRMLQLDCLCLYGAFVLTCIFVSARSGFRYVPCFRLGSHVEGRKWGVNSIHHLFGDLQHSSSVLVFNLLQLLSTSSFQVGSLPASGAVLLISLNLVVFVWLLLDTAASLGLLE
jgi:hypothetical protein